MNITIKDLARETGLTSATISAYFNGASVRPYNRDKIERAVEKLGYIRNDYARALRTHRSMTVGVLLPELYNAFAAGVVTQIEDTLKQHRYGLLICDCRSDVGREGEAVRFLQSKTVDGLIVIPSSDSALSLDSAISKNLPLVAMDRYTESRNISHVVLSNRKTAREATARILAEGRRKVGVIYGDQSVFKSRERLSGYREAMREAGLDAESFEECGDLTIDGGYEAMKRLLRAHPDLDGIFITSYEMTMGAAVAVNEAGLEFGKDISFTGFDCTKLLPRLFPGIHMVVQPLQEMGRVAAETLLAMINGGPIRNIVLDCKVI